MKKTNKKVNKKSNKLIGYENNTKELIRKYDEIAQFKSLITTDKKVKDLKDKYDKCLEVEGIIKNNDVYSEEICSTPQFWYGFSDEELHNKQKEMMIWMMTRPAHTQVIDEFFNELTKEQKLKVWAYALAYRHSKALQLYLEKI